MAVEFDDESLRWIEAQTDRRWSSLLDYWRQLTGQLGRLPRRAEIDPVSLPGLLPNLFLVDVVTELGAEPRFRFRLLGGAITSRESVRPGQFLDEFGGMLDSQRILDHYGDALNRKARIREASLAWDHPTKAFISYHVLLLPLSDDGVRIDTLLGLAIYEA